MSVHYRRAARHARNAMSAWRKFEVEGVTFECYPLDGAFFVEASQGDERAVCGMLPWQWHALRAGRPTGELFWEPSFDNYMQD